MKRYLCPILLLFIASSECHAKDTKPTPNKTQVVVTAKIQFVDAINTKKIIAKTDPQVQYQITVEGDEIRVIVK